MTSFFSDLEEQLREAAEEQVARGSAPEPPPGQRGRRSRRRGGGLARQLPVLAAVAVTLAVVAGALILLGHRAGPSPAAPSARGPATKLGEIMSHTPKAQLKRELGYIESATQSVGNSSACRQPFAVRAKSITGSPAQGLLSTLGVLRRPATAADRLSARSLGVSGPGISIYAGHARRAFVAGGAAYYIVPVQERPAGLPSAACFALQARALAGALPKIPPALRASTQALQAAFIAADGGMAKAAPTDAICQVTIARNESRGAECGDTPPLIRRGTLPSDDNGTFSGVVPDGVASVTVHLPPYGRHPARSLTAAVHGNMYAVGAGSAVPFKVGSLTVTWRSADGRVLKTVAEPSPASLKQMCRSHPGACLPVFAVQTASTVKASATARAVPAARRAVPAARGKAAGGATASRRGG